MKLKALIILLLSFATLSACVTRTPAADEPEIEAADVAVAEVQFRLGSDQTHNQFSASIPPVLTVPSGAVIEVETQEATDGQVEIDSDVKIFETLDFSKVHALTGPVYVESAEPGDVLAVTLHRITVGSYGWSAIIPNFGVLADEFPERYLKTYALDEAARKATRYMLDYLQAEHGLDRREAYILASVAADLKIAELVDMPHVLVTMHIPKAIFTE
jgi:acetamidase/formamidase